MATGDDFGVPPDWGQEEPPGPSGGVDINAAIARMSEAIRDLGGKVGSLDLGALTAHFAQQAATSAPPTLTEPPPDALQFDWPDDRPDLSIAADAASGRTPPPRPRGGLVELPPGPFPDEGIPIEEFDRRRAESANATSQAPGTTASADNKPQTGGRWDEVPRLVKEIRDSIRETTRRAASGQTPPAAPPGEKPEREKKEKDKQKEDDKEKRPGLGTAFKPITDRLTDNKLGRIGKRAVDHVRQFFGQKPQKPQRGRQDKPDANKPQPPKTGRATGKLQARPVGGKAPTGAAAGGGRAAAAGGAARGGAAAAGAAGGGAGAGAAGAGAAGAGAGAAGGGAAAAGGGAMAAAGPAAVVVAAVVALVELARAGKELAYQQEEHARKLAEVSPSQAANVAQLDMNRMVRDFEKGEDTAESSAQLMESLNKFEQAMQPLTTAAENALNILGSGVMDVLTELADIANALLEAFKNLPWGVGRAIKSLLEGNEGPRGQLLGDFLEKTYQDEARKAQGARDRLNDAKNFDPWDRRR